MEWPRFGFLNKIFIRENLDRLIFSFYLFLLIIIGPQEGYHESHTQEMIGRKTVVIGVCTLTITGFIWAITYLRKCEIEEKLNPTRGSDYFIRVLAENKDIDSRVLAAKALGRTRDPDKKVIDSLLCAYDSDPDVMVREEANKAINHIDGKILDEHHVARSLREAFLVKSPLSRDKSG